jgi:hypothetical protein
MRITAEILTEFKTGKPRQSGAEGFITPYQAKLLGTFAGNTALTPKEVQVLC